MLFGVGDEELRGHVRAAHDAAAREAVGYLERSAAAVRRGHGGAVVEEASGLVAAAFRHRTSRAGDPQLHTHVLVANLGRGADGRWSALDGRRLYAQARAASFVYQAVLRGELTRDARGGVVAGAQGDRRGRRRAPAGAGRVQPAAGGDRGRARRARDVGRAGGGGGGAGDAERRRPGTPSLDELVREWRARAAELGLGRDELELIVGRARSVAVDEAGWRRVYRLLEAPHGLTHRKATFTRADVIQALCEQLPAGARVDVAAIEAAADRFLASSGRSRWSPTARLARAIRGSGVATAGSCRSTGSSCATRRRSSSRSSSG